MTGNDRNPTDRAGTGETAVMSARDFLHWGAGHVAYVKPVDAGGQVAYAIHLADGRHLGFARSREGAVAAILREDLEPASVH
jgi:hypothetical protein